MDSTEHPVPALVRPDAAASGDRLVVPDGRECPVRDLPAPFAGLRWRLVPDTAIVRRPHADA